MIRHTIFYSGRVQGVGFRYTTCRIAENFAVVGTVRNLPDGRVELIAEGQEREVQAFLEQIQHELSRHIRQIESRQSPATGTFSDFTVAF